MWRVVEMLVRLTGVVVLGAGVVLGAVVIGEAWNLYQAPQRISTFAEQVESASGVDQAMHGLLGRGSDPAAGLHLSYYLSWIIVLLLLSLLTRVAFGCMREGSRMALWQRLAELPVSPPVRASGEPAPKTVLPRLHKQPRPPVAAVRDS